MDEEKATKGRMRRKSTEAYGAMMTLAPAMGSRPMPGSSSGTWASHFSSWLERVGSWSEYQDPACVASLEGILDWIVGDVVFEIAR